MNARPDLLTKTSGLFSRSTVDMSELGDVGTGILVSGLVLLIAVAVLLVAGSAASL